MGERTLTSGLATKTPKHEAAQSQEQFPLEDATRGSAAIPGLFPPRQSVIEGRVLRLVDGGVTNCLPVEKLFEPPFKPEQILVVDISSRTRQREETTRKVEALKARHAEVPIVVVSPDTIGKGTVIYHNPRRASFHEEIRLGLSRSKTHSTALILIGSTKAGSQQYKLSDLVC